MVAPYCHGWSSGGKELLRGVQVGGESASGGRSGFRRALARLADPRRPRTMTEAFEPDDPDYSPEDVAMARIHCRVWLPRIVGAEPHARTK